MHSFLSGPDLDVETPSGQTVDFDGGRGQRLLDLTTVIAREDARPLADRYWPGPLTLVLPAEGTLTNHLNPGQDTLGMRIPACAVTRSLLARCGPLATTSANRSGGTPSCSAEQAAAAFPALPLLAPLPWPQPSGLASTF